MLNPHYLLCLVITTITTYMLTGDPSTMGEGSTLWSLWQLWRQHKERDARQGEHFFYFLFFHLDDAPNPPTPWFHWNLWSTNIWSPSRLEPWCLRTCSQGPGANSSAVTEVTHLVQKVVIEEVLMETSSMPKVVAVCIYYVLKVRFDLKMLPFHTFLK